MAEAIIGGILDGGLATPQQVRVGEPFAERRSQLSDRYSVAVTQSNLEALDGAELVIAAGAAGVELLPAKILQRAAGVKVAIDLNAVPPAGIEGINVTDMGVDLGSGTSPVKAYGAIAVGGIKIKIHKAAIASLFDANDRVLDADQIYELGKMM